YSYFTYEYKIEVTFFFQAENGIRDRNVTGVQTCALPISIQSWLPEMPTEDFNPLVFFTIIVISFILIILGFFIYKQRDFKEGSRSEERRVGKECKNWK